MLMKYKIRRSASMYFLYFSVEQLYQQLIDSGHPVIEPLILTPDGYLSIKREVLYDPKSIYALFYIHG